MNYSHEARCYSKDHADKHEQLLFAVQQSDEANGHMLSCYKQPKRAVTDAALGKEEKKEEEDEDGDEEEVEGGIVTDIKAKKGRRKSHQHPPQQPT